MAGTLAPDAIGSIFGSNLAQGVTSAPSGPLPTTLGNVSVSITDSSGVNRPVSLFFVSPSQVNFLVPFQTLAGNATVLVSGYDGKGYAGTVKILPTAPGLFSANATGKGVPAATYDRYNSSGFLASKNVAVWDNPSQQWLPTTVFLGPASEQTYLTLYGTGIRYHSSSASAVTANVGGVNCTVAYAGAQNQFPGLDQINVLLPLSLNGKGTVSVQLTVEGVTTNMLSINIGTTPGAPSLSSLSPSSAIVGSTTSSFRINGSNLTGSAVSITPATGMTLTGVTSTSTYVNGNLAIAPDAATGARTISVLTDGGVSNSLTFTVNPLPIPSISSILPWSVTAGQSTTVSISGSNLSGVTGLQFTPPDGITVSNVNTTSTAVSAVVAVAAGAQYGARQVAVVSPAGTSNKISVTVLTQDPNFVISSLVVGPGTNTPYLTLPVTVTFQDPTGAVSSGQQVTMDMNISNGGIIISAYFTPSGLTPGATTGTFKYTLYMPGYTWVAGKTIPISVNLEAPAGRMSNTLTGSFITQ